MKKLLTIIALVLFIGCGMASAKDPEYEVTINIVYNSIPVHEIANLMRDQLREHKDACTVEVKIKSLDEVSVIDTTSTTSVIDTTGVWMLNTDSNFITLED